MALVIYNTLSRKKEVFEPLVPGEIRMYACGPTVYDRAHVGHARAALTFDVIRRYLEYRGYTVHYVRNYTDVDDKIIQRAAELGLSRESLVEEQIDAYRQDMEALGLKTPTMEPRATQHIQEMITLIQTLVERGVAYAVDGDVYFEVRRSLGYGKLSHRSLDELLVGARIEADPRKRDPLDFALWKASRPGEPIWESPWGPGRPGWHIECSAMSMKYLGVTFDIHGGGADLIFPHHENEIAQSECATGKPFARYWIHNGFVNIRAEKMSKSTGNILTVRDLLGRISPGALKLFLLGTHYRAPVDFSEDALVSATVAVDRFMNVLDEVERIRNARSPQVDLSPAAPLPLYVQIRQTTQEFTDAMEDDFNTPRALAALFALARDMNVAVGQINGVPEQSAVDALCLAEKTLRELGSTLGGLFEGWKHSASYVGDIDMAVSIIDLRADQDRARKLIECGQPVPEDIISRIIAYRNQRRNQRDWATADAIRDWLAGIGVIVDDTVRGTRWRVKTTP